MQDEYQNHYIYVFLMACLGCVLSTASDRAECQPRFLEFTQLHFHIVIGQYRGLLPFPWLYFWINTQQSAGGGSSQPPPMVMRHPPGPGRLPRCRRVHVGQGQGAAFHLRRALLIDMVFKGSEVNPTSGNFGDSCIHLREAPGGVARQYPLFVPGYDLHWSC